MSDSETTSPAGGEPRADAPRDTDRDTLDTDTMKWVSGATALVGLWILASPFVYGATETAFWNNVVVGAAIVVLAGYNFARMAKDRLGNVGVAGLTAVLGLWAAVSPFVMEMGDEGIASSTAVSGIAVALLSAYDAYSNRKAVAPEQERTRTRA